MRAAVATNTRLLRSGVLRVHHLLVEEKLGSFGEWTRLALTLILLAVLVWWLCEVRVRLDVEPIVKNGAVALDPFKNAQNILLVVLPLASTALGYWFGAQGKEKAQATAEAASAQLNAVVDSSKEPLLKKAMEINPKAFGLPEQKT